MVVSEGAINNIMGGMENTTGVRLHSHRHKLKQRFDIVRKLGQGTYGKVQLALNKETKQQVAIKTIKKAKIETEQDLVRIRREIQIMSSVQHPQIIHIYEVFENREKMVLVMEYAAGGELYDYLSERKVLPEEEARRIFRQVASAVYYCHKHKICHRDLKLENILLDRDGNAKIADFGLSNVFDEKQRLDTFCGSPLYASPEIVKGVPYVGPEVDCWSLGVLLYTLVYGAMPFDGSNFRRLVKQITQGDFYEPSTPANASDLIRQMLTVHSTERANIADICSHWWVNEGYSESCLTLAEDLANQTPVRLDLLLSLVPKHISSEHMLIQPEEEDISQKSDSERGPPDLKIPPPPALDDEAQMEPVPLRSHSLGAVPPSGGVTVDILLEKKKEREKKRREKEKEKESTSKKPPSRPTNEEERKTKKKEEKLEEEKEKKKVKRVDSPSERDKEKIKKRDISNDREKAKKRERSGEREKVKKRDSSGDRAKVRKKDASDEDIKKDLDSAISKEEKGTVKKADSGVSLKTSMKKEKEEPVTTSKISAKENKVEESKVVDGLSSTQVEESKPNVKEVPKTLSSKSISKSLSKSEAAEKKSVTKKLDSKVGLVHEDEKDTEKILKETAAKIEKVESFIKKEGELVSPVSSSPLTSPVMSPPVTSPLASSQNSSFATSPVRSRTGSESSTEAGRQTKSESSSRRQSKIFSKAALFEPSLSPQHSKSPPPQNDKPKKITTRPGALNMSDLTKRFEDKSATEKKNKAVTPFKVSDTRKAFENKVEKSLPESSKHKTSVSSIGEVGQSLPKDSLPASPTKGDKLLVNSLGTKVSTPSTVKIANKTSRETSPTKKLSKSPTKESPPKEVSPVKKEKSPKKEISPVKTVPKPVSKISSFSKLKEETPKEKKNEPPSEEVIKKGKDEITTATKKASQTRIPPTAKFDTSDSSESESEAEKMLRELSEKREKLEIAKKEKLKKVSEGKEAQVSQNNSIMRDDSTTATPAALTSSSSVTSQPESRDQKYATLPRGFKSKTEQTVSQKPKVPLPKTSSIEESNSFEPIRKKSQVEIVLQTQNRQPTSHLDQGKRSSQADIHPQPPRSQFRSEIQRSVGTPEPKGPPPEPQLHRARRERIIPIMLEDDTANNEYNNKMATSSRSSMIQPSSSSSSRNSSVSSVPRTVGFGVTPLSSAVNSTATADRKLNPSPPEPIRKSRRERIIPIAVEGEGLITPPISESRSSEKVRPYQRQGSRGRGFTLDRAESFSSAGEDEEDEEDDGFQILTAESLFSTLLSRVRSLTRKMGEDSSRSSNVGSDRLKRGPLQPGINSDTPSSAGSSGTQSGFWSSLYSPPRDLPARTIPISRGQSREEDPFSGFGPPLWERSLSRNTSDSDSVFSEPSGPFSTLPRGWRARRSARDERLVEGEEGLASFTPSRRQFYSRTLSRDLPLKTSSEELKRTGSRNSWDASTSSGTIPRAGTATGSAIPKQFQQESSNKLASKISTPEPNTKVMRESNSNSICRERPLSAIGNTMSSGETYGRVGGHFDQHKDKSSAFLKSDKDKQESNTGKQSVQQLKDLVNELESVTEENSDAIEQSAKSKVPSSNNIKSSLQTPKPSKSFTSLQMQQHNLINQSNSNPNIVFSITISSPRNQQTLPKIISSNANYNETNKEEKNSKEYGLSDTLIKKQDDNQQDSISAKKTPKNTFTPYSPNSSNVDKNVVFNKQKVNDTTQVSIDIKNENVADNQFKKLAKNDEAEKTKDLGSQLQKSTENIKTGINLPSYLKSNDTFKVENKHLLNVEPYRKGRSEDLRVAIDLANSSSSSTVDSGRSIKPYRKSKSRDITPTIEAASERFTQLNSGTLRKISPFEAYRRSKSKELSASVDMANNSTENRIKSPPPPPAAPPSDSIMKSDFSMSQFEKAKTSIEKKFEKAKSPPIEVETTMKEVSNSPLLPQEPKDDSPNESQKEKEKQCKELKESDKPKSVYKILTTKFTRSLSNLGEDKQDKLQNKDNTEENDKEEKFKLKRPSIFMKTKMEKSSSKTSIAETEEKNEDPDKNDKKSNKLSYALNKFLGRKPDDTSNKISKNEPLNPPKKSTSAAIIPEKSKKPPRFRTKKFSKSQENLNRGNEDEELDHETRSKSVLPDSEETSEVMKDKAASKDTGSHLSQIEIKITPTINNTIQSYDSKPKVSSPQNTNYTPPIASYGLSSALINKRLSNTNSSNKQLPSPQTEPDIISKEKGCEFNEERSITPTEYSPTGLEDIKEADESVMDRITRKSYYSRFNEMKRKPKPKRIDSRETMDQQLAAAKARLMQEESKEIASSSRMTPQRSFTSISPPLISDGVIRRTPKGTLPRTISLPPDDGYIGGSRNSPFNNQEENYKSTRYQSSEREPVGFYRSNSITREEQKPYRRQLSTNLDEAYSNQKRLSSVGRDDPPFFLRQPSAPRDDNQPTFRLPSIVKDETPSYRRLSAALRDEPQLRNSPSASLKESTKDKRQPSIPREIYSHRRSLSRDFSYLQKNNDTPTSINSPTEFQPKIKESNTSNENYEKSEVFAAANAAGKAAGEAAAAAAAVSPTERIPSPLSNISASDPDAVKSAREELTRRLTPLTRLSSMGSGESRPYRRTITSGNLPLNQFSTSKTTGLERPYRRTTTTDLAPLDSRIRTNEPRRFQEPSRRFSGVRSVENGMEPKPSPAILSPSRSPYSYATPTSSFSPFQSPPSMNTILRRTSLYRY